MKACNQCGKCCQIYADGGLSVTAAEVQWWEIKCPDVAEYVRDGEIWFHPASGKRLSHCPWLRQTEDQSGYTCRIYHDRPDDCRYYPVTIEQMVNDECEMIEVRDLQDPQRAQRRLDQLMVDSRPPVSP